VPPVLVPAVVGVLLLRGGQVRAGVIALEVAVALAVGFAWFPRFRVGFHRTVAAIGAGVGHVLAVLLLAPLFVFVFVPARVAERAWRALTGRGSGLPEGRWTSRDEVVRRPSPSKPFEVRVTSARGWVLSALGLLAALLVVDLAAGAALGVMGVLPGPNATQRDRQEATYEAMLASPALRDEPWAAQWAVDMTGLSLEPDTEYEPYLAWGHPTYTSEHVNVADGERRSYGPVTGGETFRVAFFGGSTMFGYGQRDEGTIPSWVGRIAEQEGVDVQVDNYGLWGWTSWQEALYLEQLLAEGNEYDLVVFYDGVNEVGVQYSTLSANPTHGAAPIFDVLAVEYAEGTQSAPSWSEGARELVASYQRHSAVARVLDELTTDDADLFAAIDPDAPPPDHEAIEANALEVYARSVALTQSVAAVSDVPVVFFWQPKRSGWSDSLRAGLPEQVVDLSDAMGGEQAPIYIDDAHTNEVGARLVAEAMWPEIVARLGL
jgi:lysophospholipase L1-like esterase